jgi:hypothetical protein
MSYVPRSARQSECVFVGSVTAMARVQTQSSQCGIWLVLQFPPANNYPASAHFTSGWWNRLLWSRSTEGLGLSLITFILSRVYGFVTNNNGFWHWIIRFIDTFFVQSPIIIINYKGSQSIFSRTLLPWLPRTRPILVLSLSTTVFPSTVTDLVMIYDCTDCRLQYEWIPLYESTIYILKTDP